MVPLGLDALILNIFFYKRDPPYQFTRAWDLQQSKITLKAGLRPLLRRTFCCCYAIIATTKHTMKVCLLAKLLYVPRIVCYNTL